MTDAEYNRTLHRLTTWLENPNHRYCVISPATNHTPAVITLLEGARQTTRGLVPGETQEHYQALGYKIPGQENLTKLDLAYLRIAQVRNLHAQGMLETHIRKELSKEQILQINSLRRSR